MKKNKHCSVLLNIMAMLFLTGCVTHCDEGDVMIPPDAPPEIQDVRTMVSRMTPGIVAVKDIQNSAVPKIIKISKISNSSTAFISESTFKDNMIVALNDAAEGKIRFLDDTPLNDEDIFAIQNQIIRNSMKSIAAEIAKLDAVKSGKAIKVAVLPVININSVNMNADSFIAMFRAVLSEAGQGNIQILLPGTKDISNADFYLTAQFIPQGFTKKGFINLAEYIQVVDARMKAGMSMYVTEKLKSEFNSPLAVSDGNNVIVAPGGLSRDILVKEKHILDILNDPELRKIPKGNKSVNIIFADAKTQASLCERMVDVDKKHYDGSDTANYRLSGRIEERRGFIDVRSLFGLQKKEVNYRVITVRLTSVEDNQIVWTGSYSFLRLAGGVMSGGVR